MYLMGVDDMSLEDVRDILRKRLHAKHPTEFPMGTLEQVQQDLQPKYSTPGKHWHLHR